MGQREAKADVRHPLEAKVKSAVSAGTWYLIQDEVRAGDGQFPTKFV